MIRVLRHNDVGQEPGTGQAALDRPVRRRLLHDAIASRAAQLRAYGADYLEAGRDVFQSLGHILAQQAQRPTAIRAAVLVRFQCLGFPWQLRHQRAAPRPVGNHRLRIDRRFRSG